MTGRIAIMPKQMPSVPPANRSEKGTEAAPEPGEPTDIKTDGNRPAAVNVDKQGQQGNMKQNVRHPASRQRR
jgi:hypothetical protein